MQIIASSCLTFGRVNSAQKKESRFAVKEVSVCATIYWFAGRGLPLLGLWQ